MKTKILMLSLLLLVGCGPEQDRYKAARNESKVMPEATVIKGRTADSNLIERFHDDEMSATCWIVGGRNISCIPDTMLIHRKGAVK